MNALGWLIMIVSISSVLSLTSFCLFKVLSHSGSDTKK
jgi:hypothetical protein